MTTRRKSTGTGFSGSTPQKETVESLETIVEKEPVVETEPEEVKVVAVAEPAPVVYTEITPAVKPQKPEPKHLRHPRNIPRFSNK
jgi:hypothetical protein